MPAKRLPWVKLWPELMEREKVRRLTDSQYRTWTYCLLAGSQQPTRWRFQSLEHAAYVTRRPVKDVRVLAEHHFLDQAEDGVWIHDAHEYQDVAPSDVTRQQPTNEVPTPDDHPPNGRGTLGERSANARENSASRTRGETERGEGRGEKENYSVSDETVSATVETSPGDNRIDATYAHFKARIQPRSRLCPRKKIAARMKRFSPAELCEGIDHFADDPWWMEHNADKGAEWFFESDARSEQFLLMHPRASKNITPIHGDRLTREQAEAEFGWMKDANA